jgi:plasmid stabilization system protein ParE
MVPEIGSDEYREVIFRRAYRLEAAQVSILTVRHTAQELDETQLK